MGRRVHILGTDPRAFFIAHRLASYEYLEPVKLLINKRAIMNSWEFEGKRLLMLKGERKSFQNRAEAEWVGKGKAIPSSEHIEQLIVTIPCCQTVSAIYNIKHRIDSRTTICLIQDGLGVAEELNATLFQDPTTRPTYILGHMAASIGYYKPMFFSSMLRKPGKLYLTALERGINLPSFIKFHPPVERRSNAVQFMRTLVATDGLSAGGYSLENYLIKKLPAIVFQCIIEPMAIAIDATYDQVLRNEHAILLADELLEELFNVIWALPELTNFSKVVEHCGMDALRKYTLNRLADKGPAQSQLLSAVRAGKMVDIDYLNGYFVKRGQELGIKMPQNEMVVGAVKARIEERRKQLRGLIPFEGLASLNPHTD
ncbi:putative Pan5, 2-dehydropantoate 2-reductase [Cryphonectria parasitica EP155]|uniref:Pan5, 2-dehydropantoate 2-reductase n=1 Tax=Cryphonectria parasitica (strain ATCC 38755 / EP155) TaxID=660469 RepID=A0A9P5CN52_CRYP1|nr:putative Pan5, 2-dehydropantoate 2-reductase [Cryphonectria parasitica EP155]KAF3765079.1 putative Pan5, 2-dehydropantoate 2-reductase [Cryphonectria parasitica EP155]